MSEDKIKIVPEMFDGDRTPLRSAKVAEEIARRYPVLVSIERTCDTSGEFIRKIDVSTFIFYKASRTGVRSCVELAPCLLEEEGTNGEKIPVSWARAMFKDFDEAEQWVQDRLNEIRKRRAEIMAKKRQEKESEKVIIED